MSTFSNPGLDDLRAQLRALPAALTAEAGAIVLEAADRAEDVIYAAYPERTGNLRDGLKVEVLAGGEFGAAARLVNTSRHAWLYEKGYHGRGASPRIATNVFLGNTIRIRAGMWTGLADLVRSHGIAVSGEPDRMLG